MRNAFAQALYEAASSDPRIFAVVADISPAGAMEQFAKEFPERFINVGVAEQAMIGICAGLALRGQRPFAYTIAPFALYRPFEMVRDDLCYQNLPVTVVGMGAGVLYSTLGGTHHTTEDVAIATALPNMTVIAPCDPAEVRKAVQYCATRPSGGPVYLRIGKAGEHSYTDDAPNWEFGKLHYLWKAQRQSGLQRTALLAYGGIIRKAIEISGIMKSQGLDTSLISCHTLKPLDREGIAEVLRQNDLVLIIEEHGPQGGLINAVKCIAWDIQAKCVLYSAGLQDKFVHAYGSHDDLLKAHGL